MKRIHSIKYKILGILMGALVPMAIFILCYNIYMLNFVNDKVAQSGTATLNLYRRQFQMVLEQIESEMTDTLVNDNNFKALAYMTTPDPAQAHFLTYDLCQKYKSRIGRTDTISACMIYSGKNKLLRSSYGAAVSGVAIKESLESYFKGLLAEGKSVVKNSWTHYIQDGQTFLYRIAGYQDTYEICLIRFSDTPLLQDMKSSSAEKIVFFSEGSESHTTSLHSPGPVGEDIQSSSALTDMEFINSNGITLENRNDVYFSGKNNKYLVIPGKLEKTDISMAYIMEYNGVVNQLNRTQTVLLVISIIILCVLPVAYFSMKRLFFRPMDKLEKTMEAIKSGNMDAPQQVDYTDKEFIQVNDTFTGMLEQIKELRIEKYEKELETKNVALRYYQKQIRPHFYLNCLKSLFGLAQKRDYSAIQENILILSDHLRYMLRNNHMAVALSEELSYVENYIRLQQMNAKYPPECDIHNDLGPEELKIPPISILSFVENSVKYYQGNDSGLKIKINICRLNNGSESLVNISVYDNGTGFSQESLKRLNYLENTPFFDEHIGIYNVIQRFKLYYGDENAVFAFSNDYGAKVDIFIREDEGVERETNAASYCG